MLLIDVHTHMGQFQSSETSANAESLCAMLRLAGITHAITFSAEACSGGINLGNRYTISQVERSPMLFALLVLHPHHYENSVQLLNEFANHPKVLGVKLHPQLGDFDIMDQDLSRLVEEEIAPRGLTVLSHVANDAPNVTADGFMKFTAKFPNVNFVAAHMGVGILGNRDAGVDAWLERRPKNVWFDLGTLRIMHSGALQSFLDAVDENQVCFGTDAPLYWPAAFSRTLETLGLAQAVYEKIAWKNALQAFPKMEQRLQTESRIV
jgi:uncharacterized protein